MDERSIEGSVEVAASWKDKSPEQIARELGEMWEKLLVMYGELEARVAKIESALESPEGE